MASGEKDLGALLRGMAPALRPGIFVYCTFSDNEQPAGLRTLCTYDEAEGRSAIIEEEEALRYGIPHRFRCALITLNIHSDLAAVGFMSEVLGTLAALDIPCNVVSAYYHDHLFLPIDRADEALTVLQHMSRGTHAPGRMEPIHEAR
jgi:hypothetical protein